MCLLLMKIIRDTFLKLLLKNNTMNGLFILLIVNTLPAKTKESKNEFSICSEVTAEKFIVLGPLFSEGNASCQK